MKSLLKDLKGNRPLLIQPSKAQSHLESYAAVNALPLGTKMSDVGDMLKAMFGEVSTFEKFPPYAIIPVHGVIGKGLSDMEKLCGCCDIEDVEEMHEDAVKDSEITTIIFDIESPGGCSVGVPELANRIKACPKNTIAFTDDEACSAAYWLGSQAKSFYATPSATVGSIGVYIAYPDMTQAYANEGVRVDVIKAGQFKGAGIPGTSLDEGQRKMLQDEVNEIFADFKSAVKSVREFVEDSSMEGQTFSGKKGAEAGLVTGLVNGFDELMESLDAEGAKQMEADEENDKRHGDEIIKEEIGEEEKHVSAAIRALGSLRFEIASMKPKAESEAEDDSDEDEDDDDKGIPRIPTENKKLPPKMGKKSDEDEDDEDEETEADADADADAESEADADADADAEAKHHLVISDFDGTIKAEGSNEVKKATVRHLAKMEKSGRKIHIVTGRSEADRAKVAHYLTENKVPHHALHMKAEADAKVPTPKYKVDAVKHLEAEGHHIGHIVENDKACTEAYTEAGWHCVHPDTIHRMDAESDANEGGVDTDEEGKKGDGKRHKGRHVS